MAMQGEADPIIKYFGLKEIAFHNPVRVFANEDQSLILSLNGTDAKHKVDNISTQAATLNAHIVIQNYKPDLIINCGTAGGFISKGGKIGDVYIATEKICFHDRRIDLPGGFKAYAKGNFPCINSDELAAKTQLKQGIISSSDALDFTETDTKIMQENNASVKEMEAAAIAWVCEINQVPFTAIKAITDIVDGPHATGEEFLKNFEMASFALKEKMLEILNFLLVK